MLGNMKAPKFQHLHYGGDSYAIKRGCHYSINTLGTPTYVHFKTNIPISIYLMASIEAVGYNYALAKPIRCAWSFYTAGTYIYSSSLENAYSGLSANGIYVSSDNYVVIRGYATGMYFIGFALNTYTINPSQARGFDISILAESYGTNSGAAW
jgi:hypothetical protein